MQTSIILTCSSCHEKLNFYMKVIDSNVVLRVYKCENCKKTGICSICGEGVVYKNGVCQVCYEYEEQRLLTPRAVDGAYWLCIKCGQRNDDAEHFECVACGSPRN